jgi:hypothetical protein
VVARTSEATAAATGANSASIACSAAAPATARNAHCRRQHTSAYVSIRQHTTTYVAYVSIRSTARNAHCRRHAREIVSFGANSSVFVLLLLC